MRSKLHTVAYDSSAARADWPAILHAERAEASLLRKNLPDYCTLWLRGVGTVEVLFRDRYNPSAGVRVVAHGRALVKNRAPGLETWATTVSGPREGIYEALVIMRELVDERVDALRRQQAMLGLI